ncbi:hypothetical protein [Chitinimonas naiadis]
MSSISAASASFSTLAGLASSGGGQQSAIERRVGILQQQCADVAGCTTTPTTEKLKQQSELNQQISGLRSQLSSLEQTNGLTDGVTASTQGSAPIGGLRNLVDIRV